MRFLPFSLLLVIMILGQSMSFAGGRGHYVPREKGTATAASFMNDLRANQNTGLIDPALMIKAAQSSKMNSKDGSDLYWVSMGPDNFGGQTTAVVFDNRPNSFGNPSGILYIGSKGGGVYKSYNNGTTWHLVDNANLMVSCMVQDADGTIYVGTGDGNNAVNYNGLSQISYTNSFVGSGIYTIIDDKLTQLPSTAPTSSNGVTQWSFVNDLAIDGNYLIAATESGLKYSTDKGATWSVAKDDQGADITGNVNQLDVNSDGVIIASIDKKVYIGTVNSMTCHSATAPATNPEGYYTTLPAAAGMLDIAAAPSNANVFYASCIATTGIHSSFYLSEDGGSTWRVILPAVTTNLGHNVYQGFGLIDHGIVVNPSNAYDIFVLGYNLWELTKVSENGYYIATQRTDGSTYSMTSAQYLHVGLHTMVFNPNNNAEFYVGTDGGVFRFKGVEDTYFTFYNCNRNYVTTRFFTVAPSGKTTRAMGGAIDFGSILINGDENTNNLRTGTQVYPNSSGAFSSTYHGGPCAISLIDPNSIFVSIVDGGFYRSETAGVDYDFANFTANLSFSNSSFRTPMLLWERFNDPTNPATVKYKPTENMTAGTTVQCQSNNKSYPFDYVLPVNVAAGDSIYVHDPVSAKFFIAGTDAIYFTREAVQFNVAPTWWKISKQSLGFDGDPLSMAISNDGDNLFVGMKDGVFCRLSNLNAAIDTLTCSIDSSTFAITTTVIDLPTDGQCVTSVAVDPNNANNVVVTLGNYGNQQYVLYSNDALSAAPTFVSKQANLPKMPVYSSVIEMTTGNVIIGTEHGIYMTDDIANPNWVAQNDPMGDVPVLELKQQLVYQPDQYSYYVDNGVTFQTVTEGVKSQGAIYAATYGRGLFRCENYLQHIGTNVDDAPVASTNVSLYPNPVQDQAKLGFELAAKASVSYQIFDMAGRMVKSVELGMYPEGSHEINVNANGLSNGAYILRLSKGDSTSNVKFLVY